MQTIRHALPSPGPGTERHWISLHFGARRNGRKTVIQCSLHADEIPGLLVGLHLRRELQRLEDAGAIEGEIVLVPMANPIGLAQSLLGSAIGRFELGSGVNFNRGYRNLVPELKAAVLPHLGSDAAANTARIRAEAARLLDAWEPTTEAEALKRGLQRLAIDADIVLDLHSDSEALIHLYAPTPHAQTAAELARCLGAQPVLLARESGDDPFDESVCCHWWELREAAAGRAPVELACFATTIELRGERDVDDGLAAADAAGLLHFLARQGHLQAAALSTLYPSPPAGDGEPLVTALEAVDPVVSRHAGVLVWRRALGDQVQAGQTIAEVIDPLTAEAVNLSSSTAGLLFARTDRRWVQPGQRVAKVAGQHAIRSGKLLSP